MAFDPKYATPIIAEQTPMGGPPGLPGAERTSAMQAQRKPAGIRAKELLMENAQPNKLTVPSPIGPIQPNVLKTPMAAFTMASLPFERLEAAVSNAIEPLQDPTKTARAGLTPMGGFTPQQFATSPQKFLTPTGKDVAGYVGSLPKNTQAKVKLAQEIGSGIIKGLKGEKLGQMGDLLRRIGAPEPVAATMGLIQQGVLSNPLTIGTLGRSIMRVENSMRSLLGKRLPTQALKPGPYSAVYEHLSKFIDDAGVVKDNLGKDVSAAISKTKHRFPQDKVNAVLDGLIPSAKKYLFDPDTIKAYGIKYHTIKIGKKTYKVLDSGAENIWAVKRALDGLLPSKTLASGKDITPFTGNIYQGANAFRGMLRELGDDVVQSLDKFSSFANAYKIAQSKIKSNAGLVMEKGIRNLEKVSVEEGLRQSFSEIAKVMPQLLDITTDSANITQRLALKRGLGSLAKTIGTIGLLRAAFHGIESGGESTMPAEGGG